MVPNRGRACRFMATLNKAGQHGTHSIHVSGFTNGQYETFDNCDSVVHLNTPAQWVEFARSHVAKGYELRVTECRPFPSAPNA